METQQFNIKAAESSINWIGKKVTGAHNGTIAVQNGTLKFSNGKLIGGNIVIDTTSIKILDVTDPDTNRQFAGHLASDDFFSIENYPSAALVITSVAPQTNEKYFVEGNLTIKGITHPISFDTDVAINGTTVKAFARLIVDRTKYNMKFRSGNFFTNLGDTLIYNEFELNAEITAAIA